jgi:hypothetical protein
MDLPANGRLLLMGAVFSDFSRFGMNATQFQPAFCWGLRVLNTQVVALRVRLNFVTRIVTCRFLCHTICIPYLYTGAWGETFGRDVTFSSCVRLWSKV